MKAGLSKSKSKTRRTSKSTKKSSSSLPGIFLQGVVSELPEACALFEKKRSAWKICAHNKKFSDIFQINKSFTIQKWNSMVGVSLESFLDEERTINWQHDGTNARITSRTDGEWAFIQIVPVLENEKNEDFKNQIVSLISHELKTPLVSIINAINLLDDPQNPLSKEETGKFMEVAKRNATVLNENIETLLDLAENQDGRYNVKLYDLDINSFMKSFEKKIRNLMDDKDVDLAFIMDDGLPHILGNALKLEKALTYLVQESIKHAKEGTQINIKVLYISNEVQPWVEFSIEIKEIMTSLDGSFDPDRLFEIFGQKDHVLTRREEGIGAELFIAREIISHHRGFIRTQKTAEGLDINCRLPLLESEQALKAVLESRMFARAQEIDSVSLIMIRPLLHDQGIKKDFFTVFLSTTRESLYRASDTMYYLSSSDEVAIIMDDCKKNDAVRVTYRIIEGINAYLASKFRGTQLEAGLAACPEDSLNPEEMIAIARNYSNISKALIR